MNMTIVEFIAATSESELETRSKEAIFREGTGCVFSWRSKLSVATFQRLFLDIWQVRPWSMEYPMDTEAVVRDVGCGSNPGTLTASSVFSSGFTTNGSSATYTQKFRWQGYHD
jgi:hypothetical protein